MRRIALRLGWLLWTVVAAAVALPATASADGGLTLVGGELRYDSDSQDAENLVITRQTAGFQCAPAAAPCLQIANGPQDVRDNVAGATCVQVTSSVVSCDPSAVTSIFLKLDDGDDYVLMGNSVPATTMDGSFGNDNLSSANGADTIRGGPGDDEIYDDDLLGDDTIDGGDGDDLIFLGDGDDDVVGGAGTDTVTMGSGDDTVRLDDLPNDGRPGETKNVHSDVEVVDGDGGSDNLFGNAAANTLRGGSGNDIIDAGAGPDVVEGGTGADDLNGGPDVDRVVYSGAGAQTITLDDVRNDGATGELDNVHSDIEDVAAGAGDDVVVGSAAANVLDGGDGADRLQGLGGEDTYAGGAGADTLLARDGIPERVDCGADADGGEGDTTDVLIACEAVALSAALVPDADGDGVTKPSDCNDDDPAIRPGALDVVENGIDEDCSGADAVNLDRDGDGFPRPADCNDANRRIHPGATDIPGNKVDEDCRGGPAPYRLVDATIAVEFGFSATATRFTALTVRRVQRGSTLRIRCTGPGCPFTTRRRRLMRTRASQTLASPLGGARLRPGAKVEVRVSQPQRIALVVTFTVRSGKAPQRRERCLAPGARRVTRCPGG